MSKQVKRGFVPTDERDFGEKMLPTLRRAAQEVYFLLCRGYDTKTATTFVGNHYQLSERQRLALARVISPEESIRNRKARELSDADMQGRTLYIDGFNCIITLEIAYSDSMLFRCMDGTIRDLAGLHGTYRLVDKTDLAITALLHTLTSLQIEKAVIYLDAPVSNSGRLRSRLLERSGDVPFMLEVQVENAVDHLLKQQDCIASADAIILDECTAWYNLTGAVIAQNIGNYPFVDILPK